MAPPDQEVSLTWRVDEGDCVTLMAAMPEASVDAGFEIRDCLMWLYGSGFPKSLDVSKAIDAKAGHVRGERGDVISSNGAMAGPNYERTPKGDPVTAAAAAAAWEGWGTALKPAHEPIVLARKPLAGTVIANVLAHGTGALNVDGCRIAMSTDDRQDWASGRAAWADRDERAQEGRKVADVYGTYGPTPRVDAPDGRWPSNIILDPEAAALLDTQVGDSVSHIGKPRGAASGDGWGMTATGTEYGDNGGISRFFYTAKASSAERSAGLDGFEAVTTDDGRNVSIDNPFLRGETVRRNVHPTVKPIDLMRWLVRLATPPGGTILDPFTGSGTTGIAAVLEGFSFIGLERQGPEWAKAHVGDDDYAAIARARIAWWERHPKGLERADVLKADRERRKVREAGQIDLFGLDG